ncbi:hypothetical protein QA601_06780 [Chitinispirillales bacterium ANBcel5]|uniref:hypothetical protein n=1 Tax=Cellulosispirillum alkaliphilum TaxID=3039283 RepID=UPI002A5963BE|nr:hypothetical protein [Chitinispirillales bacterium ANBcel5]
MKESSEKVIKVGFRRKPKEIFDEIDKVSAEMVRQGWALVDSCMEDGLGFVHLFFEREVSI